jgi:hypothetical protein
MSMRRRASPQICICLQVTLRPHGRSSVRRRISDQNAAAFGHYPNTTSFACQHATLECDGNLAKSLQTVDRMVQTAYVGCSHSGSPRSIGESGRLAALTPGRTLSQLLRWPFCSCKIRWRLRRHWRGRTSPSVHGNCNVKLVVGYRDTKCRGHSASPACGAGGVVGTERRISRDGQLGVIADPGSKTAQLAFFCRSGSIPPCCLAHEECVR